MDVVPEVASVPDHPPVPMQEVALVDVQESVELEPLATLFGVATRLTVGSGVLLTATEVVEVALPPRPLQVNV